MSLLERIVTLDTELHDPAKRSKTRLAPATNVHLKARATSAAGACHATVS